MRRIHELWKSLDNTKKIIVGVSLFITIILFISIASFSSKSSRILLYDDLRSDDYGKITKSLDSMGYSWSGSGTSAIYVKPEKRQKIITKLAQDDLIPSGVEGYEIFDISRWDETTFDKNIKLHRAVKGSLEKMLMTLDFIKKAKVELAIPQQNHFLSSSEPVKASIVITLVSGTEKISRKKIMGIKNLVYRAVPKLKRENITITDDEGNEFMEPDELDQAQRELDLIERKKSFEEKERKKWLQELRENLWDFYPADRITILRVALNIKWNQVKEKQKTVSPVESSPENPETPYPDRKLMPNGTLIVSQNKRNERFRGNGFTPGGPTGTEKQLPPGYRDLDYQRSEYGNDDTITNYAFNSSEKEITHQAWEEKSRSIAVVIDGIWKKQGIRKTKDGNWQYIRKYIPPSEEELSTLERLLKASLLYDAVRGDQIEVRHLQKDRTEAFEKEDEILTRQHLIKQMLIVSAISLGAFLLAALLYRSIKREIIRRRRIREEELAAQQQLMRDAALRASDEGDVEIELSVDERARREMLENAITLAREKPDQVAKLLRTWLSED